MLLSRVQKPDVITKGPLQFVLLKRQDSQIGKGRKKTMESQEGAKEKEMKKDQSSEEKTCAKK